MTRVDIIKKAILESIYKDAESKRKANNAATALAKIILQRLAEYDIEQAKIEADYAV